MVTSKEAEGFAPADRAGSLAGWDALMGVALAEARAAGVAGDVPVGAVVAGPDGSVLGVGRNRREADGDPTAHAEVSAAAPHSSTRR